jgi:hypothetical protein
VTRSARTGAAAFLGVLALTLAASAVDAQQPPAPTERLTLKGKRGPKLLRPGYQLGEFTGSSAVVAKNVKFFGNKDSGKANFDVTTPDMAQPVVVDCAGGASEFKLVITWDRDPVSYNCNFGGGAPPNARLEMAFARGNGILAKLQGNNRAGEIHWKDQVIQFETAAMKGLPLSAGKPAAYVFKKDGMQVGRMDVASMLGVTPPTFELPVKGAPEREAVAMAMLALYFFPDPGDRRFE